MVMSLKDKLSVIAVILLLSLLVILNLIAEPQKQTDAESTANINPVGQADMVDLFIVPEQFTVNESAFIGENIFIRAPVWNRGTIEAEQVEVIFYLEHNGNQTELERKIIQNLGPEDITFTSFFWTVPAYIEPGEYFIIAFAMDKNTSTDLNIADNEAFKKITIKSILEIETHKTFRFPGKKVEITTTLNNIENQKLNLSLNFYYFLETEGRSNSGLIAQGFLEAESNSTNSTTITWVIPKEIEIGRYQILVNITNSSIPKYINGTAFTTFKIIEKPDTEKEPVYTQIWFIVGLISLIIFFLTIIFSLIGVIPQDRLPIQPALVVMAMVIMVIALVGHYVDPEVHLIGAQDIAGMVIIHPITALTAGFLVAGGLEAAGAFAAAADALGRIEKLKFKGKTIFGFVGTVTILTNIPTLIAMPCGRILGAALMPAALFFGYRIAKAMGDARMVGVVVFPFIVNAAASCGPSPLGGIGTIGEGLSKMPIGSFTTAQSTGIMICTGVCALFMRYITPMRPADLSDEDIKREMEAEQKRAITKEDLKDVEPPKDIVTAASVAKEVKESDKVKSEGKDSVAIAKPVDTKEELNPPMAKKVEDKT